MAVNPMMEGAFAAGVNGLNSALNGLKSAAQDVAELNVVNDSTGSQTGSTGGARAGYLDESTEALVSLKLYQRQAQAAAKVVATADAVVGFLLDVHA